jgi:2-octaprenyl-6-methoxyphenol hydroxylase
LKKDLSKNSLFKKKYSNSRNISFLKDYDLIINCDYSHHITKKFFDKKIKKKYKSLAYTTIIEHKKILNNTATQIFTQKGPLAFLPISSNQTSIVFSIHNSVNKKENIKELIKKYNHKYKIYKIHEINFFELSALNLRSYYHNNILAFGDLLHKVHPLAGQGFNMTLRDIKVFLKIIKDKQSLGLPLNSTINYEFEKRLKHKNFIFSNGIDLIHNFFNFERKFKNKTISKSIQYIAKNPSLNRVFTKIADEGIFF